MLPPKRPRARKNATPAPIWEERGVTVEDRDKIRKTASPMVLRRIDPNAQREIELTIIRFGKFLHSMNGTYKVGGKVCKSWEEATDMTTPPWDMKAISPVIIWYAITAKPTNRQNKRIRINTLYFFLRRLLNAYSRTRNGKGVTPLVYKQAMNKALEIGKEKKLRFNPFFRPVLNVNSLLAMISKVHTNNAWYHKPRRMLTTVSYIATSTSTGLRSSSLLANSRSVPGVATAEEKLGLIWESTRFWAVAGDGTEVDTDGNVLNDIIVYIIPRTSKTKRGQRLRVCYPLFTAPYLGLSANRLLLIAAKIDGALGDLTISEICHPNFLEKDGQPRLIPIVAGR